MWIVVILRVRMELVTPTSIIELFAQYLIELEWNLLSNLRSIHLTEWTVSFARFAYVYIQHMQSEYTENDVEIIFPFLSSKSGNVVFNTNPKSSCDKILEGVLQFV